MSHVTQIICMNYVTLVNESCRTREWGVKRQAYKCVMSYTSKRHVTHMNASRDTHMNASRHTYKRGTPHTWKWHMTHIAAPFRDQAHVCHDTSVCHNCHDLCVCHDYVPWLMCTHIYAISICMSSSSTRHMRHINQWMIFSISMNHFQHINESSQAYECVIIWKTFISHIWMPHVTQNSYPEYVTWRIHTCDMTYSYVWHDVFIRVTRPHVTQNSNPEYGCSESIHTCVKWVVCNLQMTHYTHANEYTWLLTHMWMSIHDSPHTCVLWEITHDTLHVCDNSCVISHVTSYTHTCKVHPFFQHPIVINIACHTSEWVLSHIWVSHVTHMNASCHMYEWFMSHIWISHVTHLSESCHTYEWVMSNIWMSHVTGINESCHTYEWFMSHVWIRHVTRMNTSCHTYEYVMSYVWMSHGTRMEESFHTYE